MQKNGKRFMGTVLILFLLSDLLFAGGTGEKKGEKAPVEIVSLFSSVGAYKELLEQEVDRFNNTIGKDKSVKIEMQTQIDNYLEALMVLIKAGTPPDIFYTPPGLEGYFSESKWIMPLEDVPGLEGLLNRFEPYLSKNVHVFNDKTYVLPIEVLPVKMAYNKDLFRKAGIVDINGNPTPPKTWDEVVDYAKRITDVGNGEAFGYGIPLAFHPWYWKRMVLLPWIASIGHYYFDHTTGRFDFTSFKPAIEFMLKIRDDKSYFPGPESINIDPIRAQFSDGRIGMLISPAYDIGVFNDQFPAKCDWDICDMPVQNPDNRYKEAMLERSNWSFSGEVPEDRLWAVAEAFKFLHSKEHYAFLYANNKIIPSEHSVIDMAKDVKNKTGWENMSDISKTYLLLPWPSQMTLEGPSYAEVLDMVWAGDINVDEALADIDNRYNAALDRAVKEGRVVREDYMFSDVDLMLK